MKTIPQEDDRPALRPILASLGLAVVLCVLAVWVSNAFVGPSGEPNRAPNGGIFTGLLGPEREGQWRRERDLDRLESAGPVSSGTVHVPIERAFDLVLPRLLAARPEDATVDEHLGAPVPLELSFTDTALAERRLGDFFDGRRPVLLVLAYERCPRLCSLVLHGAERAVKALGWRPGERFRALTASFDPEQDALAARARQDALLADLGGTRDGWAFLTGKDRAIERLTDAIGFRAYRDPTSGEYAHPAVLAVLSPDGRVSRYLYGIDFRPKDLELALLEAGAGKTGTTIERVLLRCYRWDGTTHRYELAILSVMRATGAVIFVVVAAFVTSHWRKERRA
jgi:protein SCO1/2